MFDSKTIINEKNTTTNYSDLADEQPPGTSVKGKCDHRRAWCGG